MAMFVLVVDTSLMNVSISAVVQDLGTTVSGVQSAIALEALVSAAFILISSKIGDLIGRRLAYVIGLLGYAVGALAMTLAQTLVPVIIFWAIVGGLGASLLLPAMQSLIHGNFEGAAQKRVYALVGASAAIAAAIGPLLGGFVTTFLSWRVGFLLELIVIGVVLSGIRLREGRPVHRRSTSRSRRRAPVRAGHGWHRARHPRLAGGAEAVGILIVAGIVSLGLLWRWLTTRNAQGKVTLIDPNLLKSAIFRLGISGQTLQNIALGGAMIALPIFLQMVLEYNALQTGLSLAPLSLTMFAVAILAGRRSGVATLEQHHPGRLRAPVDRRPGDGPARAPGRLGPVARDPAAVVGSGLGLLVSQLNNYTLAPISEERISEAAGVNSAAGSFGLSFGLALAGGVMLATLAFGFTAQAESSVVLDPAEQQQVSQALEDDAELMTNTQLEEQLVGQPADVQAEIIRINTEVRPVALQVALLVPLLAGLIGLFARSGWSASRTSSHRPPRRARRSADLAVQRRRLLMLHPASEPLSLLSPRTPAGARCLGRLSRKVVPAPGLLVTDRLPPLRSAMLRAMVSPRPLPAGPVASGRAR